MKRDSTLYSLELFTKAQHIGQRTKIQFTHFFFLPALQWPCISRQSKRCLQDKLTLTVSTNRSSILALYQHFLGHFCWKEVPRVSVLVTYFVQRVKY